MSPVLLYHFILYADSCPGFIHLISFLAHVAVLSNFSGTGALAIFLRKACNLDITTSDYEDQEIEENIAHNCRANEIPVIPHIKRESSVC